MPDPQILIAACEVWTAYLALLSLPCTKVRMHDVKNLSETEPAVSVGIQAMQHVEGKRHCSPLCLDSSFLSSSHVARTST